MTISRNLAVLYLSHAHVGPSYGVNIDSSDRHPVITVPFDQLRAGRIHVMIQKEAMERETFVSKFMHMHCRSYQSTLQTRGGFHGDI